MSNWPRYYDTSHIYDVYDKKTSHEVNQSLMTKE